MKFFKSILLSIMLLMFGSMGVLAEEPARATATNNYGYYWDFTQTSGNNWQQVPTISGSSNDIVQTVDILSGGTDTQQGQSNYHKWFINFTNINLTQNNNAAIETNLWFVLKNPENQPVMQDAQLSLHGSFTSNVNNVYFVVPQGCKINSFILDLLASDGFLNKVKGQVYFVTGNSSNTGTTVNPDNPATIATLELNILKTGSYMTFPSLGQGINLGVNMTINNALTQTLAVGTNITVNANLNINAGTIQMSSNSSLTINPNATLNVGISENGSTYVTPSNPATLNFGNQQAAAGAKATSSLIVNSNGKLNIGANANVNMYADSTLENNGTIDVQTAE